MSSYTKINGHPTWVVDRGGAGEPLLLLHGGLSNSDILLDSIGAGLGNQFHIVAYDRRGHGRTADTDADFHYADMATEAIQVLQEVVGGPAHLVGWSDGGIIGLLVALERPDLVRKLVVIGTNYHYDGIFPMEPDPQSPFVQAISTAYIERSPDGADHLDVVFGKGFAMFGSEPTLTSTDMRAIALPTLVMVGDDDVVKLSHTCSLYEALPEGQLAIVPGASHALPVEKSEVVSALIVDFLSATDPPRTLFPIRRAGRTRGVPTHNARTSACPNARIAACPNARIAADAGDQLAGRPSCRRPSHRRPPAGTRAIDPSPRIHPLD